MIKKWSEADKKSAIIDELIEQGVMLDELKEELGKDAKVVATGGLANLIAKQSKAIDVVEPFLTLDGLYMLYKRNS